jgi:hypothetical protein
MMSIQRTTVFSLLILMVSLALAPLMASAQVKSPGPYVSEMRDQCIAELAKDAEIRVACMTQYSDEYHAQDAKQATKNNKHVVMAYGALWGIVAIFVVGMWLRQRKLSGQILQLEAELKKAAAE